MSSDLEAKQAEVQQFWNAAPCDSTTSSAPVLTREYFEEIERQRYDLQSHILDVLKKVNWAGKDVLEIGTGVGTDARRIIQTGGRYTGINVDQGSVEMTARALRTFGLEGRVEQVDATRMPFADNSFDVVYSFGVLHHIPNVKLAVSEIRRVLKPGGELLIMLYNRSSINYQVEIRYLRKAILRVLGLPGVVPLFGAVGFPHDKLQRHVEIYRGTKNMSDEEWLSRNTDGPDNPYSTVYDAAEANDLLDGWEILGNGVYFFNHTHWGPLGRMLPRALVRSLGRSWGWHRVLHARKTG